MKKLIILIICVALGVCYNAKAQVMSVSGDVAFYSKNLSTFTGLMFGEEPAMVAHMNVNVQLKDLSMSAAYSGQLGIQHLKDGDRFNMLDLSCGYQLTKEVNVCVGYELTYSDNLEDDEIGHGIFGIATWSNKKLTGNFIFFADPRIQNTYYISSVDLQVMKNVSIYLLGGYTNTKSTRWYGLGGLKYSKGNFFAGTYYILDKSNPGPVVSVGVRF